MAVSPFPPTQPPPPVGQQPTSTVPPSLSLGDHLSLRFRRTPRVIDLVMVLAAAGSFFHHVNGAGFKAILVWWTVWALLWVMWARTGAGVVGPIVSVAVLIMMLAGPRTHLGFDLQRDCFETKAATAIAEHESYLGGTHYQGEGNCGLMTFSVATQEVRLRGSLTDPADADGPLGVWFTGAGETNWGVFTGNGIVFSPAGDPLCSSGVIGDTHSCKTEPLGDGWYYYAYTSNIN